MAAPLPMEWNTTHFFGPDGPWQTVVVDVGGSTSKLYPGGVSAHTILSKDYCKDLLSCPARDGALYDTGGSTTAIPIDFYDAVAGQWGSEMPLNMTSHTTTFLDNILFVSKTIRITIEKAIIFAVDKDDITLPNGTSYPQRIGNLAIGAKYAEQKLDLNQRKSGFRQ